jgi:hypothetical protein
MVGLYSVLGNHLKATLFKGYLLVVQKQTAENAFEKQTTEAYLLTTVDLLVLTSLDQLLFILKILFTLFLFYKPGYLNEEVNCTEPSPSVSLFSRQTVNLICYAGESVTTKRLITLSPGYTGADPEALKSELLSNIIDEVG